MDLRQKQGIRYCLNFESCTQARGRAVVLVNDKLASGQVKARLQAREGLIESMNQFICERGSKFGRSPCSLKLIPADDSSLEPAAYFLARKLNGADYIIRQHQMGRNGRHIQPGVFRYLFLNRLERKKSLVL